MIYTVKLTVRDRKRLLKFIDSKLSLCYSHDSFHIYQLSLINQGSTLYNKNKVLRRMKINNNDIKMLENIKEVLEND